MLSHFILSCIYKFSNFCINSVISVFQVDKVATLDTIYTYVGGGGGGGVIAFVSVDVIILGVCFWDTI